MLTQLCVHLQAMLSMEELYILCPMLLFLQPFSRSSHQHHHNVVIIVNIVIIIKCCQQHSTKFLGVLIDESLKFKCHIDHLVNKLSKYVDLYIDHLVNKLSKYVDLFYKIRHFLPLSALLMLYKRTLFEPHLNNCNVIWCNTFTSHLKKFDFLQKKAIRALSLSEIYSTPLVLYSMALSYLD